MHAAGRGLENAGCGPTRLRGADQIDEFYLKMTKSNRVKRVHGWHDRLWAPD